MPLPRPRSVICSPSHIRNIGAREQARVARNTKTEARRDGDEVVERAASAIAIDTPGTSPDRVPIVYCVICASALLALLLQRLAPARRLIICMMIDAEM